MLLVKQLLATLVPRKLADSCRIRQNKSELPGTPATLQKQQEQQEATAPPFSPSDGAEKLPKPPKTVEAPKSRVKVVVLKLRAPDLMARKVDPAPDCEV